MIETVVSLETARLLKEKGFQERCRAYWHITVGMSHTQLSPCNYNGGVDFYASAPTQSFAQQWIREKGIHIGIYANASGWGWILTKCGGNGSCIKEIEDDTFFNTYEDALEEGLKQALKLI